MGNCCCFKKKHNINDEVVNENGTLIKICGEKELNFWNELQKLGFVQITNLNRNRKSVEFSYSNYIFENYISVSQIMEYLISEQNFLYFTTLFEITIAMVDFIQIIFMLKNKYGINKNDFFFINFEKFYLMKEDDLNYSKLVYIDEKLNDNYACAEILFKEEGTNMLSSFSILEENGKSFQNMISNFNSSSNFMSSFSINLNSYFYSKCNERFQKLKNNYSLSACEKFYAENIVNFVSRILVKKVIIPQADLEHDFINFKLIIRHTLSHFFKTEDKYSLQNVKMLLTNFYLNNYEYAVVKNNFEEKVINSNNTIFYDKVLSYRNSGIALLYGDCDVVSENIPKTAHKIVFTYDYINNPNNNINTNNAHICIDCASSVIIKKSPDNIENVFNLHRLEEEIIKKHSFVDILYFLKYLCSYFESDEKTKKIFDESGENILIYKKNKYCVTFEMVKWDDHEQETSQNEILNLDFNVKNTIQTKKVKNATERVSLYPTSIKSK
jgi:hypothetical protein